MTSAPDQTVLDASVIEQLTSLDDGEGELLRELIELFMADTPPRLETLAGACRAGDADSIEKLAHSLKSSAGNMGAIQLTQIFKELETLGREGRVDDVAELVARCDDEYGRVCAALKQYVS